MARHPNPNLPGGNRAHVSPTPEGGPAVGSSPARGRVRRVAFAAAFVVAVVAVGYLAYQRMLGALPDQSAEGVVDFQVGLAVVSVAVLSAVWPLLRPGKGGRR